MDGLKDRVRDAKPLGDPALHAWQGLGIGNVTNPLGSDWVGLVFGLGFVLSFGYWTTNFAEVQRALSAKNMSAARRTPLIGAYPKIFLPAIIILPGLIAAVTVKGLGGEGLNQQYNTAIPHLMGDFLPEGMLGVAVTGLIAAFMAGVAANVTSFNTVVTYDLIQSYFARDRDDQYYLRAGRLVTVGGILISVGTAFIAKGYSNIMNYIQTLFSIFNAPLFATFIIAMFWRGATPWGGFWSLVAGTGAAYAVNRMDAYDFIFNFDSPLSASFWQAIIAFLACAVVLVVVSLFTKPKPDRGAARAGLGPRTRAGPGRGGGPTRQALVALAGAARRRRDRPARRPEHHLHLGGASGRAKPISDEEEDPRRAPRQPLRHPPADRRRVPALRADPDRAGRVRLLPREEQGGRAEHRPLGRASGCSSSPG